MSEYTAGQVERAAGSMRVRSSDELEVERMLCAYAATLRQQAERGDVADLTNWQRHYSIGPAAMDALSNLLAPLLRAPAEQGGRVDVAMVERFKEAFHRQDTAESYEVRIKAGLQAALAQNAQGEEGKAQWDEVARILGADGDNVDDVFAKAKAHAERARVPEGQVLVPCEPTREMQAAGKHTLKGAADSPEWQQAISVYKSMLTAAPSQPEDAA